MFVQPGKEERERIPALKNERDIRFFDVKLQNKSSGQEAEVGLEVKERMEMDAAKELEDQVRSAVDTAAAAADSAYAKVVEEE